MEYSGFYLTPIGSEPEEPGDLAPPQLFELIRPNRQAITLGRLYTSCVCVALEADKAQYAQGEQVILRLRNVRPSPPEGTMYALYVQLRSPVRTILRVDTFMRSSQFVPAKPGEAPTRGNIVADGVLEAAGNGVEIIVPKADTYIPDTSEYTLRLKAEAAAEAAKDAIAETGEPVAAAASAASSGALNAAKEAAIEARAAQLKK